MAVYFPQPQSSNPVEVEVCGWDANAAVQVCVAGHERRVRLKLPEPPCGTAAAARSRTCTSWETVDGKEADHGQDAKRAPPAEASGAK